MKEIEKCKICEPYYHCLNNGENGRLYYFAQVDTYFGNKEKITECPILRKSIEFKPNEHKEIDERQTKLTNWKTGETYDKL